jgi:hypothetical protein
MRKGSPWEFGLFLLLAGYVIVVPTISVVPGLESYNERRTLQIGVLLLVGTSLLSSSVVRRRWVSTFQSLPSIARWALGSVVGLGILSSALGPAPFSAFLELSHFGLLFVAAGVVASAIRSAREYVERVLLGTVVLSALLYAVRFFVGYGVALSLPELELGRETLTGFQNIRFFNQYQTWTLPLLGGAVLALPKRWRIGQGVVLFLAALWWTLVFASNVRGTVVAMAVAAIGVWLLFRNASHRWLSVQGAALLAGGILYCALFTLPGGATPEVVDRLGEVGQSRRLQHWRKCLHMVWQHPVLGGGPMHYAWPPFDFASAAHPHNAFMQWLAEWGVPSTAIMSGLTIWGGWWWLLQEKEDAETANMQSNAMRIALIASILTGTAHAMVSGIIVMPLSQILLILIVGWAWGRYKHNNDVVTPVSSFRPQAVLCIVLIASIGIVGSSLQDLSTVEERHRAFAEAVDRNRLSPRYWAQGYLHVRDPEVVEAARRAQ